MGLVNQWKLVTTNEINFPFLSFWACCGYLINRETCHTFYFRNYDLSYLVEIPVRDHDKVETVFFGKGFFYRIPRCEALKRLFSSKMIDWPVMLFTLIFKQETGFGNLPIKIKGKETEVFAFIKSLLRFKVHTQIIEGLCNPHLPSGGIIAFRATSSPKMIVRRDFKVSVFWASHNDFRKSIAVLRFSIIISTSVNVGSLCNELCKRFPARFETSLFSAGRTPASLQVGDRLLLEQGMFRADDLDFGFSVDIFDEAVIIFVPVNIHCINYKLLFGFSMRLPDFNFAAFPASVTRKMVVWGLGEFSVLATGDAYSRPTINIFHLAIIIRFIMDAPSTFYKFLRVYSVCVARSFSRAFRASRPVQMMRRSLFEFAVMRAYDRYIYLASRVFSEGIIIQAIMNHLRFFHELFSRFFLAHIAPNKNALFDNALKCDLKSPNRASINYYSKFDIWSKLFRSHRHYSTNVLFSRVQQV